MMFYKGEMLQIFISVVTISLAFSLAALTSFPLILFTVGIGFILHELAHKAVAQHFGAVAYYKAWMEGLALAIVIALATGGRFTFAAPGAVYIHKKNLTRREDALISGAGPFVNIVIALFFLMLVKSPSLGTLAMFGFHVNAFLALFNLIPVPPLDGSHVFRANFLVWAVLFLPALYLTFFIPVGF